MNSAESCPSTVGLAGLVSLADDASMLGSMGNVVLCILGMSWDTFCITYLPCNCMGHSRACHCQDERHSHQQDN